MRNSLITIFSVLFLDQLVKLWIKTSYSLNEEVGDWFIFKTQFVENDGMAFGWTLGAMFGIDGGWAKVILSCFRIIALILIAFYIKRLIQTKAHPLFIICISLVFAGALGNALDGAFYGILFSESTFTKVSIFLPESGGYAPFLMGKVVDMFEFTIQCPQWLPWYDSQSNPEHLLFPFIFNVADMAISCSVIFIIIFYKKIVRDEDFQFLKKKKSEA